MTLAFRSDVSGGVIQADGQDRIKILSDGTIVFPGVVQSDMGSTFQTGDFMFKQRASAPPGWIAGIGQTIGNGGSGATLANVSTQALFFLWWSDYTDAQLPVFSSLGSAKTRGSSALNDWNLLYRMRVFDVRARFPRASNGTTVINGTSYADAVGPHVHATATSVVGLPGSGGGYGYTYNNAGSGAPVAPGINTGPTSVGGVETVPLNIAMLGCYKL